MHKPIALWSTPRSSSTAFDRMMRERGDHRVFTEPFSLAYYDGPDRVSTRFGTPAQTAPSYAEVWAEVLGAVEHAPVFVKEMPHHLGPHLQLGSLERFRNSFLIRDPAWAVPSMLRIWRDAADVELGYMAQREAFQLLRAAGHTPVVVDAHDLRRDPARVVARWCDAMGIDFLPRALSWKPGLPDGWKRWPQWFEQAAASTGFAPPDGGAPPAVSPEVNDRIERCRADYAVLHDERISA